MARMARRYRKNLFKFALLVALISGGFLLLWVSSFRVPDLSSFEQRKVTQSTKIYDRTGEILLYDVHENITRTVIPFDAMSRNIKNATVAIEDAEFYEHFGVKPTAFLRAMLVNLLTLEFSQGGSTITQQVVKNSLLTQEKKISRKLKEWVLAVKLEQELSKEEILELYLNETPYGGSIYGIEEASQSYFGKSAAEISLAEAAYLAALPQAPTYYSPYGNNRERLEERKKLVLARMLQNGFITDAEFEEATREEVTFLPPRTIGIRAPHFVFYVREYLEQKYGQRAIEERGLRVITTLDMNLQTKAEEIVGRYALENVEKFNAENAGMVAIDPTTGNILALVGSRNYFDDQIDGNFNVALAKRQPGSAFKPFVYATAFKEGFTPETVVFDLKTQFSTACAATNLTSEGDCYSPGNYDNVFRGPVQFREALAQSINVPAVKVLYLTGITDAIRTARDLGISTLTTSARYGLTLVLGGGEVTLLDITSAYGVFANAGVRNPAQGILRIEDSSGNIIEEFVQHEERVLDEQVAFQITDILSDNAARTPAFGSNSPLYFPGRDVAAKTGTTNDSRDAWIIGYTPNIAVGAWAGNNDNSPMVKEVAGFIVAPMWHAFMEEALASIPNEPFQRPVLDPEYSSLKPILRGIWQGGETYTIDKASGKLATEHTPMELREERAIPNVHSILHWIDRENPRGPNPENPSQDPQYGRWESRVAIWKVQNGIVDNEDRDGIPSESDDTHNPENAPRISITSPAPGTAFDSASRVSITVSTQGKFSRTKVDYFVDGRFVGSSSLSPFSFIFTPKELGLTEGEHSIRATVYDSVLNQSSNDVSITID